MASQPNSVALRDTIATLDASIAEADLLHDAAVIASREAVESNLAYIANNPDTPFPGVGDIVAPSTGDTAARLAELHRSREIAEVMLSRALESERLSKVASDRITLAEKLNRLAEQGKAIDAATVALADLLASFGATAAEVHAHIQHTMGARPIPGTPTIDVANAIGGWITQSQNWNPSPHKPAAAIRADGFARNARSAAGIAP